MNANSQKGFVLVATIWVTLILLVLAGLFSSYAYTRFDAAVLSKERVQEAVDRFSTEQTLLYLFATGIANRDGLSAYLDQSEFIPLDSKANRGFGKVIFDVIDIGGLIGLNSLNNYHLEQFLAAHESDPLIRNALLQSLYDYIDINESPRLNGGEAAAYRVSGLNPPPNNYLKSPQELKKVLKWSSWLEDHPEFDLNLLSTNWRSRLNLNTAPDSVLRRALPLRAIDRELLISARQGQPFKDFAQIQKLLNMRGELDEDVYTLLPMSRIRIRIFSENNARVSTINASITPLSLTAPWVIDSRYDRERNFNIREPSRSVAAGFFGG